MEEHRGPSLEYPDIRHGTRGDPGSGPPKYSEDDFERIAEQAVRQREALGKPQRESVWRRFFGSRKRSSYRRHAAYRWGVSLPRQSRSR